MKRLPIRKADGHNRQDIENVPLSPFYMGLILMPEKRQSKEKIINLGKLSVSDRLSWRADGRKPAGDDLAHRRLPGIERMNHIGDLLFQLTGQLTCHPLEHFTPVARFLLTKKAHGRIPRAVLTLQKPTPASRERQHGPDGATQRSR